MKKIVLWVGTVIIVLMCFFPPWVMIYDDYFVGYAFLFYGGNKTHIDLVRLIVQCAIVGLITGVSFYTLNNKKS